MTNEEKIEKAITALKGIKLGHKFVIETLEKANSNPLYAIAIRDFSALFCGMDEGIDEVLNDLTQNSHRKGSE